MGFYLDGFIYMPVCVMFKITIILDNDYKHDWKLDREGAPWVICLGFQEIDIMLCW